METNAIVETIKAVFVVLLTLETLATFGIQVVKEGLKLEGTKASVLSYAVGFIVSGLVSWYWIDLQSYQLVLGQWIGVGMAFVLGGLAPSGGYKLFGAFAGTRQPPI